MNKGESTRQRIIVQAAPIFNQKGYDGCSMQDVMDATGLEKGGLYRHFASKEDLAVEAFRYAVANAVKARTEKLEQTHGPVEQLRSLIKRFVEAPSPMQGGCPLMNTAIDSDDGNPVLRRMAREGINDWKLRLSKIVEEGIKSGQIRKRTEPRRIANTIIATLEGALMISRLEGTKIAMQDAQTTLEIVLKDISASRNK
jgi:TetR/AcrR family transcriptional repressor of nem operon